MMYQYNAKVINVVDGDTIDCIVDLGFKISTVQRLRLKGVNTPEIFGASKAEGLKAKAYVVDQLLGKDIIIESTKTDSFGRWLVAITFNNIDFNQSLISLGFAVPFMVEKGVVKNG